MRNTRVESDAERSAETSRDTTDHAPAASPDSDFVRAQHRRSLFRVLARNIVRELLDSGHRGHELLPFVSEVMQAITDNGWDSTNQTDAERSAGTARLTCEIATDDSGRPTITGDNLVLRPPGPDDLAALHSWENDPRVRASLIPSVLRDVQEAIKASSTPSDRVDLVICDRPSGTGIGLVSLHEIRKDIGHAELGKVVGDPAYRGRGLAAQATRLIVAYGFEQLKLNRIYLRTLGANIKNIRLNERLGFRFEGVLREAATLEGRPADVAMMAMLRAEYEGGGRS